MNIPLSSDLCKNEQKCTLKCSKTVQKNSTTGTNQKKNITVNLKNFPTPLVCLELTAPLEHVLVDPSNVVHTKGDLRIFAHS